MREPVSAATIIYLLVELLPLQPQASIELGGGCICRAKRTNAFLQAQKWQAVFSFLGDDAWFLAIGRRPRS